MKQNRWKSPMLWAGVASCVALILKEGFGITIENYDALIKSILSVLTILGVVNNPTDKEGW